MDKEAFRRAAHEIVDLICEYNTEVESVPVGPTCQPWSIFNQLPDAAPEEGESWEAVMTDVKGLVTPNLMHWQSPNFFGFFPCTTSYPSILGELLSAGLGVNGMLWLSSPSCTEVELKVLNWLAALLQLPRQFFNGRAPEETGGGCIQGTASEAVLVAVVAARHRALRACPDSADTLVAYTTDQAHSSVKKACMIADVRTLRYVPTTPGLRMDPAALAALMKEDVAKGLTPFFVCATIGTTSTTAVDPLSIIAPICTEMKVWLHVDAAFLGSLCICPEYRHLLDGVESADSLTMNPHKWLLVNLDCSAFWVKSRDDLTAALSIVPEYLRNKASESKEVFDLRDWQIPLGRRFRSLKLWFVLRVYGAARLRDMLRKHMALADKLEAFLKSQPSFEMPFPRVSSLVVFRLAEHPNDVNAALLAALNERGVLLTHTVISGQYFLRVAIGASEGQGEQHVDNLCSLIASCVDLVTKSAL